VDGQLTTTLSEQRQIRYLHANAEKLQRPPEGMQGDREAMRAAMEKRREESNKKMKEILTEEQYAKYEKMRGGMRPRGRGEQPPPGNGDPPPPEK
jgi:CHAD domain-containing protein